MKPDMFILAAGAVAAIVTLLVAGRRIVPLLTVVIFGPPSLTFLCALTGMVVHGLSDAAMLAIPWMVGSGFGVFVAGALLWIRIRRRGSG